MPVVSDLWLSRWRQTRSLLFLVVLSVSVVRDALGEHLSTGQVVALVVGVAGGFAAWLLMTLDLAGTGIRTVAIVGSIAAGLLLTATLPVGAAPAYLLAAATVSGSALTFRRAVVLTGSGAVLLTAVLALREVGWSTIALWVGALAVILLVGQIRRQRAEEAEQRVRLDTLAERAHLAREIHDVLAHSLSALSVQLETAAALLERDRTTEAGVVVDQAGRLARDGLTEVRRAVSTLRGDPLPLPELISELAAGYRQDFPAGADFAVEGEPREMPPEAGLVLFRAAQETPTNIRKHAPGSAVTVKLAYGKDAVSLDVRNGCPTAAPTTSLSSGYGLIGLRERAELAGGTAEAGPSGRGWRVDVTIPVGQ